MSVKIGTTTVSGRVSDSNLVHRSGNESISGVKDFVNLPTTSDVVTIDNLTPSNIITKAHLDEAISEAKSSSLVFIGYVSLTDPSSSYSIATGNLWINANTMPTAFPVLAEDIKVWDGTQWVQSTETYTPKDFEFFREVVDSRGFYWFAGEWVVMSTDMDTTYFQLDSTSGKWIINPTYDASLVHIAGTEDVTGVKKFTSVNLSVNNRSKARTENDTDWMVAFRFNDKNGKPTGEISTKRYTSDTKSYIKLYTCEDDGNGGDTWREVLSGYYDGTQNVIESGKFQGTAYRALWGDLAELYEADKKYEPGTLLQVGGKKEVTLATTEVNLIVSSKPGILINSEEEGKKNMLPCALAGKVPVKVDCEVKKGDKLYLSNNGFASNIKNKNPIGIALEDGNTLVNAIVKLSF